MAGFDHFRAIAPFYERFIRGTLSAELQSLLALAPDCRVLDAGGGTGRIAQALTADSAMVVVADVSLAMLREADQKEKLHLTCAETEVLPYADETFERVLMVDALHHVRGQDQAVKEMLRVLKPGGRLVIEEPDITRFGVKLIALAETLAGMRSHFLRGEEIRALAAGENSVEVERMNSTVWVVVCKGGANV